MGHYLNVKALDKKGNPLKGTKVKIDIAGIFKGGTIEKYTDSNGHAEFETAENYESYRKLNIYVRGQSFGPYEISGGAYTVRLE